MGTGSVGETGAGRNGASSGTAMSSPRTQSADFATVLKAFENEAAKTPAERARDQVLKKHGLTEETYKALPPDKKKMVDAEISLAVQRVIGADKGKGFKGAENAANVVPGADAAGQAKPTS